MFWFLGLLATLLISHFLYQETKKYSLSEDTKYYLFCWVVPYLDKYPYLYYQLSSVILFGVFFSFLPQDVMFSLLFIIVLIMQMIVYIDLLCFRLPNVYVLPLIPIAIIWSVFHANWKAALLGVLFAFIILFILGVIRLGALGGGDLKFALIVGAILGGQHILLAVCIMFALAGVFMYIFYKDGLLKKDDFIPYGPFLFLGFFISLLVFLG